MKIEKPEECNFTINTPLMHQGREVRLTGRRARQKKPSGKEVIYHEICPLNIVTTNPKNLNYNKWVKLSELYPITGDNDLIKDYEEQKKISVDPYT